MQLKDLIEFAKAVLPALLVAVFGWLALRRLEEIKSEVARSSDFSRKWAELFFDSSNVFMVSVERYLTLLTFINDAKDKSDEQCKIWEREARALGPVLVENSLQIRRLAALAPKNGEPASKAADYVYKLLHEATRSRIINLAEIWRAIDEFNRASRTAHAEMLASRNLK